MSMWKKTEDNDVAIDSTPREQPTQAGSPATATRSSSSAIGSSLNVRGDISGYEDLVIHGQLEGAVNLQKNNITIGPDGKVKATLNAVKITVEGQVTGDLSGSERVVIKNSGTVEGNITAPRVVLEDGCRFKGSVEMNFEDQKAATKPSAPPTREAEPKVTGMAAPAPNKVVSTAK